MAKLTKNQKRRLREKQQREARRKEAEAAATAKVADGDGGGGGADGGGKELAVVPTDVTNTVDVEYVSADVATELQSDEALAVFGKIFEHFSTPEELTGEKENADGDDAAAEGGADGAEGGKAVAGKSEGSGSTAVVKKLSKKKRKLANRLKVAQLKQLVKRPDVVEVHDVTAPDPRLLVYLKSYRNTVPVPRHWLLKRKYLQGKRGVEKPPFELPECIKMTGIDKLREAFLEKQSAQNSKAKARANMTGATGKMEIDYQVLYNAFFKFKTKPKNLTAHGDLYYESKEFESKGAKGRAPGQLSDALREALGMPLKGDGADDGDGAEAEGEDGGEDGPAARRAEQAARAELYPPPWLINMQRYGPPPDYPKLKIPGLNAPIPPGATFGYNPGEWGKPPVDEFGQPLYGNVFDVDDDEAAAAEGGVDTKARWGELVEDDDDEEEEEESSEEESTDEEGDDDDVAAGIATPDMTSGISSVTSGLETPDMINLRKGRSSDAGGSGAPKQLYQVIGQAQTKVGSGALFGSSHQYIMPGTNGGGGGGGGGGGAAAPASAASGGVSVAIDPADLEGGLSKEALQQKYDAQGAGGGAGSSKAALDAITAAAGKKRKAAGGSTGGAAGSGAPGKKKPYKSDFKF